MRETICFRVFHFYRIDIKSSRYAFKELATLFIELIEHHIISSFYRKRKLVLPKPPRGKVSRNALLINGEGNGARQRAIMTLWERERGMAHAQRLAPQFECKKNQAKISFSSSSSATAQTYITKTPSHGNIVTRIRRSCTLFAAFPLTHAREGKRSLQNRFSDFEALTASLAATRIFMGVGCMHAKTLRAHRYGYGEGRERRKRKKKTRARLREIIRDV